METIFGNIHKKLKVIASIELIAGVCWGLYVLIENFDTAFDSYSETIRDAYIKNGVVLLILWVVISIVVSFVTYGFGQLIENTQETAQQVNENKREIYKLAEVVSKPQEQKAWGNHKWRCGKCGNVISNEPCPYCGHDSRVK